MARLVHVALVVAILVFPASLLRGEEVLATPEQEKFFETKIRPVLTTNCLKCHGPEKQESSLRLDSRQALLAGGASGTSGAVAGDPDNSLLVKAIGHVGDVQMPPDTKLKDTEIADITAWVKMGLPWPKSAGGVSPRTAAERVDDARRTLWSLQPIGHPPLPGVESPGMQNHIDVFIREKLTAAGLLPSPESDRRTLIRRVTFDLHGLPPSPAQVEVFLADASPDAYERLVDRLLASPRYGERWGRHWLDVARYGDTKGYAFMQERKYPYSYTYRDYVISALNRDLPYDQFVVEQLAADKLPLGEDKSALAAMGFLTTGRKFNNHQDDLDDQIDVVTRGLLGVTVACARCHDHKYDAIPTDDYYSLYGVFDSSTQPAELPLIGPAAQSAEYQVYEMKLAKRQAQLTQFDSQTHAALLDKSRKNSVDYLARSLFDESDLQVFKALAFLSDNAKDLRRKLIERWRNYFKQHASAEDATLGPWTELAKLPSEGFPDKAAEIVARWKALPDGTAAGQCNPLVKNALGEPLQQKPDIARLYGKLLTEAYEAWLAAGGNDEAFGKLSPAQQPLAQLIAGKDSPTSIPLTEIDQYFSRDERQKRNEIRRGVESFQANSPVAPPRAMVLNDTPTPHEPHILIRGNPGRPGKQVPRQFLVVVAGPERVPFNQGSGRLELAQAIVSPANPLTRRVIVNRIWMHHFGEPLVSTPSDFGIRSDPPTHPELLDDLAADLLDDGWSLKSLHRRIMLSATYRQSSGERPECRATDPENRLLHRMNRRRLELEAMRDGLLESAGRLDESIGGRPVELTSTPFSRRRAVYGFIDRQDLPNFFRVFDIASPDQSSPRRPRTAVPQQALFLMNSPFVVEQAQALAARQEFSGLEDSAQRIAVIYDLLFSRPPTNAELDTGRQFLATATPSGESVVRLTPWEQYCQILLLTNERMYID